MSNPAQPPAASAKQANDDHFRQAIATFVEMQPTWSMQLSYIFNHPMILELDTDSLHGDFFLTRPMTQQALTAVIEALPPLIFEKIFDDSLVQQCHKVIISAATGPDVTAIFNQGIIHVAIPLRKADVRAPTPQVTAALRKMAGIPTSESTQVIAPQDPYPRAADFMRQLQSAMQSAKLWPGEKPAGPIEVQGAFGCENMPFSHWLAWILIPRVEHIVANRGTFPAQSQISTYATREFDGHPKAAPVLSVLRDFDDMINALQPPA